jgi:hypothetical protein
MDTLWDKVRKNLVEWYDVAYEKTDEFARVGKKKFEIAGINRTIEKRLSELGGHVYDIMDSRKKSVVIREDERVLDLVKEIKQLEKELHKKDKEIETIREDKKKTKEEDEQEK